jgi:hypothetical protein
MIIAHAYSLHVTRLRTNSCQGNIYRSTQLTHILMVYCSTWIPERGILIICTQTQIPMVKIMQHAGNRTGSTEPSPRPPRDCRQKRPRIQRHKYQIPCIRESLREAGKVYLSVPVRRGSYFQPHGREGRRVVCGTVRAVRGIGVGASLLSACFLLAFRALWVNAWIIRVR